MESALIISDLQIPFHDPRALSIVIQVGKQLKPDHFIINGDFVEWRHMSLRWPAPDIEPFAQNVREETQTAKDWIRTLAREIKAKDYGWNDGNHEWRLFRLLTSNEKLLKLMGIKEVMHAVNVEAILGLKENGFKYSGEYPAGRWLFGSRKPDMFVHHSYVTRKKAGYAAHSEIDTRLCGVIIGHGHRLSAVWRRGMDQSAPAIEGGHLSVLGEPDKGRGLYPSVPFNRPEFLDHQQGFVVVYRDGQHLFPQAVPICEGKCVFDGKLYRA